MPPNASRGILPSQLLCGGTTPANPDATDARFLLAYHFLMLGDLQNAARNLEVVRMARPDDRVTLNLLSAIKNAS